MESGLNIVVVGSANVDIFMSVDRMPSVGETLGCQTVEMHSGGKAPLLHPYHIGRGQTRPQNARCWAQGPSSWRRSAATPRLRSPWKVLALCVR